MAAPSISAAPASPRSENGQYNKITGLPDLPKCLSSLLNAHGGSWKEVERLHAHRMMIQNDLNNVFPSPSAAVIGGAGEIGDTVGIDSRFERGVMDFVNESDDFINARVSSRSSSSSSSNSSLDTTSTSASHSTDRSSFSREKALVRKQFSKGNLDAALAQLRREMVSLRQLDLSLLCQLWSLYEGIQDVKVLCSDVGQEFELIEEEHFINGEMEMDFFN